MTIDITFEHVFDGRQIEEELKKHADNEITQINLDLRSVKFIDSINLSFLLKQLKTHKSKLIIYNPNDIVMSLFKLTKLNTIFNIQRRD